VHEQQQHEPGRAEHVGNRQSTNSNRSGIARSCS
jgi:hypothetical protein